MQETPATQYIFSDDNPVYHIARTGNLSFCGLMLNTDPEHRKRKDDFRLSSEEPARLFEKKPCITVKGIIRVKTAEGDGDYHVRLELDSDQPKNVLLNARNIAGQHGFLVFEPICVNDVTQKSALIACGATSPKKHWK